MITTNPLQQVHLSLLFSSSCHRFATLLFPRHTLLLTIDIVDKRIGSSSLDYHLPRPPPPPPPQKKEKRNLELKSKPWSSKSESTHAYSTDFSTLTPDGANRSHST